MAMDSLTFARRVHGTLNVDVCWPCHAIWFDQYESAQLTPSAVIDLFRKIHEHRDEPVRPLADHLHCPRCRAALVLTHDLQRHNTLRYHRCPDGHGRLTTFMQFLREKEFVRTLSASEIETLKATVTQVRCSSCGAVVDLERDVACRYCRSAIAVLDPVAVEKALTHLTDAERAPEPSSNPEVAAAFESILASYRSPARENVWLRSLSTSASSEVIDLVVAGIGKLFVR
jgi:DNA-directed RNA polymerase subunit RPC12/RpoP